MKRGLLAVSLLATLFGTAAYAQSEQPESQASSALLEEAETLGQIYLKLRLLGSSLDGPELQEYLTAMNQGLDKILAFRDAFTPEKRKKIEGQLKDLKKDSEKILKKNSEQIRQDLPKLLGHLQELVKILLQ